jgi:AcrR family transcriptional regulator
MEQHPTEERRQLMRRKILEAALPLFAEKGFEGTSNRDIAEAAGIKSTGLLYWYFKSKEDLFNALLDEFVPFSEISLPLETMAEVPPAQFLPLLVRGISNILNESRFFDIVRIIVAESVHNPAEGHHLNLAFKRIIDPLAAYFHAQIDQGRLRDEDSLLMAQAFVSQIGFFFIRRRVGLDETLLGYDIEQVMRFIVDAFLRAFAPGTDHQPAEAARG